MLVYPYLYPIMIVSLFYIIIIILVVVGTYYFTENAGNGARRWSGAHETADTLGHLLSLWRNVGR